MAADTKKNMITLGNYVIHVQLLVSYFKIPMQPLLTLPQLRTVELSGAQLWNSLPIELRQATSLNDFKTKLRRNSYK